MKLNEDNIKKILLENSEKFLSYDWSNQELYSMWIAQTYYYVCHSTRIIALAASRFYKDQNSLHLRFLDHIAEESNHEKLAINDLKALKLDINDLPELSSTKGFYQSQYFQIERLAPSALLGWILSLEGLAVYAGKDLINQLNEHYGARATSFVRVHAEEDEDHLEKAFEQVKQLPEKERNMVYDNFIQSSEQYDFILQQITQNLSTRGQSKKAA